MPGTSYNVDVIYGLKDQASGKLGAMNKQLAQNVQSSNSLKTALGGLAAAAAGMFGVRQAASSLVGFNSTMEQARIQMGGMIQLTSGGEWTNNLETASKLVGELQMKARESVGTTADMVAMASMLTRPILAAGLSMENLRDMTASTVVASKAMGIAAEVSARDLEQALMGTFSAKDMFARKILEPMGFTGEEGRRRFNQLDAGKRAGTVKTALANPAIEAMAKAQAESFEGMTSTLVDNLQMGLGKVGLPLFQAITKEVKTWNSWFDKNQKLIEQWGLKFSDALMSGFSVVKSVFTYIIENREMLLGIAKLWAGSKVAGAGIGMFGAIGKGVTEFSGVLSGASKGLVPFATGVLGAAGGLVQLALAADSLINLWGDQKLKEEEKRMAAANAGRTAFKAYGAWGDQRQLRLLQMQARDMGALDTGGTKFDERKFRMGLGGTDADLAEKMNATFMLQEDRDAIAKQRRDIDAAVDVIARAIKKSADMFDLATKALVPFTSALSSQAMHAFFAGEQSGSNVFSQFLEGAAGGIADKPKINITINHLEVQADDPDSFVFGMVELARDAVKNPSSSRHTLREG